MEERKVVIPAITCSHCVAAITREVGDMEGVSSVVGDPATKAMAIRFEPPATWEAIEAKLTEIGYPPEAA